jgi:hypothetical protein
MPNHRISFGFFGGSTGLAIGNLDQDACKHAYRTPSITISWLVAILQVSVILPLLSAGYLAEVGDIRCLDSNNTNID